MIDSKKLHSLLEQATKRPWKQTYAYNNAGMPTADFYIPGHSGNATVEMLACDAELLVEAVHVLPALLSIWDAVLLFKEAHVGSSGSETSDRLAAGKLFARRDDLLQLVESLLPGEDDEQQDEPTPEG